LHINRVNKENAFKTRYDVVFRDAMQYLIAGKFMIGCKVPMKITFRSLNTLEKYHPIELFCGDVRILIVKQKQTTYLSKHFKKSI